MKMRALALAAIFLAVFALHAPSASAQSGIVKFDYQDPSQRKTQRKEREERQKKAAEEAKKKADEAKRQQERTERMRQWQERSRPNQGQQGNTSAGNRDTTGTRTAGGARQPGGNNRKPTATLPTTVGGSYDPTTREVTEVMLDAIKTQHVQFDPAEAADKPGVILLNKPQTDPATRRRAVDSSIAQPL